VFKLLVEIGEFCSIYQDHALRNLTTKRLEADEISAFVGAKAKNATKDGQGDLWTYTALDGLRARGIIRDEVMAGIARPRVDDPLFGAWVRLSIRR
jgi:hypothetical protein